LTQWQERQEEQSPAQGAAAEQSSAVQGVRELPAVLQST
jgi:hypothetical protein